MPTPKLLEVPSGATAGSVPTVQADGTIVYAVPATGPVINDTSTSTTGVWSSVKTAAAIAAVPTGGAVADATASSKGVVKLGGDLAGTADSPALVNTGTPGSYGSSTAVPVITTDAAGRVTAVTTAPTAGFYFYNGTDWGTYPHDVPCVFFSVGWPYAAGPLYAADNSIWWY